MKKTNYIGFYVFLIILQFLNSCSISEKSSIACPDFKNKSNNKSISNSIRISKIKHNEKSKKVKRNDFSINVNEEIADISRISNKISDIVYQRLSPAFSNKYIVTKNNSLQHYLKASNPKNINETNRIKKFAKVKFNKNDADSLCDILILIDGKELNVKVIEIGLQTIKYKKCGSIDGPIILLEKKDIFKIKYHDGSEDLFYSEKNISSKNEIKAEKKTNGAALLGFILSLAGLLIFPLVFGIVGFIISLIGLNKIKKNPEEYKGKGLAIAGIVIGIINIGWALLILSAI